MDCAVSVHLIHLSVCLSVCPSADAGYQILWHGCTKHWMNKRMTVSCMTLQNRDKHDLWRTRQSLTEGCTPCSHEGQSGVARHKLLSKYQTYCTRKCISLVSFILDIADLIEKRQRPFGTGPTLLPACRLTLLKGSEGISTEYFESFFCFIGIMIASCMELLPSNVTAVGTDRCPADCC